MCMMAIFHDMIEETMEVFMEDFSVFGDSFSSCLSHLDKMLKWCEDTNLVLNWEKCHFMVKEGIVIGHTISKSGIEVDKAKVDVIAKLPHLTSVKGIQSFLGHAGFYRRFIQDFSKIARPMTHLLKKDTPFIFSKECFESFNILKKKLTEALILVAPDWDLPFEIMCDASDYTMGAVLGQRAENLAADHLSRLKNPHQDVLENKEIIETFPLETLGMVTFRGDDGLEPNDLGFRYEIEIASGQLVKIDNVIKGCKLEIEGHVFDKRFDTFWNGSFECDNRYRRERPEENRDFDGVTKQEDMFLWLEIFLSLLSLWPPSEMEEFLVQLKELQYKGFIDKVRRPWGSDGIVLLKEKGDDSRGACGTFKVSLGTAQKEKLYAKFSKLILKLLRMESPLNSTEGLFVLRIGWGEEQELAFQTLKDKLCNAPVLALPDGPEDFVLKIHEKNYTTHDLELGAVVFALKIGDIIFAYQDWILAAQKEDVDEFARLVMRTLIMDEAYKSKYSVHPWADKMYYDLRDRPLCTPISTKSLLTFTIIEDYKMESLARLYLNEIVARHGVPISIISDCDSRFTSRERTIQNLVDMLRAYVLDFGGSWDVHLPLVEFSYNNSYYSSVRCAPFEALYGRKCRSPIMWAEVGEGQLKAAHDRHKSYTDKRRKPLEFSVDDYVLLKVSPWKGVIRFGKKGKLAPWFVVPFEIVEKVGHVAYRLDLPEELNGIHDTFHMSNLKKCLADPTLKVPLDEIRVDAKLNFVEEPVEILEREFKKLKRSRIVIVKVRWNSKRGLEFTWDREDHMKLKYPHLFSDVSS
ncbi:putative reverse transcriptase domain-containing protein [Tanacetum coccineum]